MGKLVGERTGLFSQGLLLVLGFAALLCAAVLLVSCGGSDSSVAVRGYSYGEEDAIVSSDVLEEKTVRYGNGYDDGEAHLLWGAALFNKRPDEPNQQLAEAVAALNAAAGDDSDDKIGYGEYLDAAYRELGFNDDEITLFSYPHNSHNAAQNVYDDAHYDFNNNSFAFAIAHQVMGSGDAKFDLVVITLRGTQGMDEVWNKDFMGTLDVAKRDWEGLKTYAAFSEYADDVVYALKRYKEVNGTHFETGKTVYLITGHSLGGGAANLVAGKLTNDGEVVYGFTFGALNSLQDSPTASFDNIWNFFHTLDTFGPNGEGAAGYWPSNGGSTALNKLGHVMVGTTDYNNVFTRGEKQYINHCMAGYYHTVAEHWDELYEPSSMSEFENASAATSIQRLESDNAAGQGSQQAAEVSGDDSASGEGASGDASQAVANGGIDGLYANFEMPLILYYDFYPDGTLYAGFMDDDGNVIGESQGYYEFKDGQLSVAVDFDATAANLGLDLGSYSLGVMDGWTASAEIVDDVLYIDGMEFYLLA